MAHWKMIINYYLFGRIFSSGAIVTGYELDGRGTAVGFPAGAKNISLRHST
jgi:hypothetical protein